MTRVYLEFAKNTVTERPDLVMLGVFVIFSFVFVSFKDVLTNMPRDNFSSLFNFLIIAVRDTSWILKALIAGFLVRIAAGGVIFAHKNLGEIRARLSLVKP